MCVFLLSLSFFCLALGAVFIYRPGWIVRFNKFAREKIFSDSVVLLDRRKKGFFFILLFIIFLNWGYMRFTVDSPPVSDKILSTDRLLYESFHHLHLKEYAESKRLCERVIAREPNNAGALYQLAVADFLMDDTENALKFWTKAKQIAPDSYDADRLRKLAVRHKNLPSENIAALP